MLRTHVVQGPIMQSVDVLDFSVIHLSAFERSSHKHRLIVFALVRQRLPVLTC
jgi:hypothetical protein